MRRLLGPTDTRFAAAGPIFAAFMRRALEPMPRRENCLRR
jgi:hypothetical protein